MEYYKTMLLAALLSAAPLTAEIVTLADGDSISGTTRFYRVPVGQEAVLISHALKGDAALHLGDARLYAEVIGQPIVPAGTAVQIIAGNSAGDFAFAQLLVRPAGGSGSLPQNTLVIPTDATGNVQIILESSTDLINWVAAAPGTYDSQTTTRRFFRVRAVVLAD